MTYDSREILVEFSSAQNLGYPLLQDVDVVHVKAFGILNDQYEPGHRGYGIPHPGVFYVSADGVIRLKFAVSGYRERPPFQEIYDALLALDDHGG